MKKYYYSINGEQHGPISLDELKKQKISRGTKIWNEGLEDWKNASEIEELKEYFKTIPPPLKRTSQIKPPPLPKDKEEILSQPKDREEDNNTFDSSDFRYGVVRDKGKKYIDKWLYFGIILGSNVISFVINAYLMDEYGNYYSFFESGWAYPEDVWAFILFLGLTITNIVFLMMFLYKKWNILKYYEVHLSPSKAVGYLFIPLFNLYWVFIVFRNYAIIFNKIVRKNNFSYKLEIPIGLATSIPIIMIANILFRATEIGLLFSFANFTLILIYIYQVCDKLNYLYKMRK